ncbi:non-ribosomal peptide synthetase [Calothrix rhizosoleniae]|uniref:non-ribosomal peptide synthetase n=1 Tax=Calothrix rhizosoleniae TaxID=888997 RepID=UPI001F44A5BA|nr:non-ribosomal peptide synthetase [Calothrix rhizosoleniae]
MLSPTEEKLLGQWNSNQVDYPQDKCIHQLFEEQVEKTPNNLAAVFEQEELTYQQLNQKANQLAHYLLANGVKPETKIGICLERSMEMLIGLLAILKAGATYIPLDPAYPQQRLEFILSDAQISILLTDISKINFNNTKVEKLVCLTTDRENITVQPQENPTSQVNANHLAYIIYTSGSTGKPKGVEIQHHAVINFLTSMQQKPGLNQEDTLLAVTTISFDIAALELYLPLITGAKLILATKEIAGDGKLLSELIETEGVTVMQATPASWRMLLAAGWKGCTKLKILCGGEALTNDLARQLFTSGSSIWNLYGPTETTIWSSIYQIKTTQLETSTIPIGQPINNTQIYLYDEYQQPVPIGAVGEIYIGGSGLACGYLNRPKLNQSKFINQESGNRLYKTGDLGRYLESGNIEYIGRIDNQVKLRGFRIELGEIEAVLSQHPLVNQAVVISSEDRLVAYIVSNQEIPDIRGFMAQRLPNYMVPNIFVNIETIPLTPNGKVDRKALPAPDGEITREQEYVAPRNQSEEIIARIFSDVLGVENVGIYDNFFELGGHSLLATQLISRLRKAFEVEIQVHTIFESSTVVQLEEALTQLRTTNRGLSLPAIQPRTHSEQLPLSFAQERLWLLNQIEGSSATYNIPAAVRITGKLDVNALQESLSEIVRRHEILRTSFQTVNGKPIQVIYPEATITINMLDLQQLVGSERETVLQQQVQQETIIPFDLEVAPLIRCNLLQLDATEYVLLLTMHHIISDGWSMGVLIQEVYTLYPAFCAGGTSPLAELPIQYADFALWQRQWLQGDILQQQLDYWKQQLGTNLPVLQLPTSDDKAKIATNKLAEHTFLIPGDLAESIYSLNRQEGVTLFMTLLAAFNILLQRYSNQDEIVVGTDIANRNRAEIESLIGFFINILVLRNDLSDNPTFQELLGRVRQVTLDAYAHQDLPFAELVKALQPNRGVNTTPLFQVLFVLQNVPQSSVELPELTINVLDVKQEIAKFDIALFLTETEQGITGKWQYKDALFEGNLIAKMSDNFQTLLENIVKQPDTLINDLEIFSEAEKEKQKQQKQQRKNVKRKKFINAKPKAVNFSQSDLVKTSYLHDGEHLPLVITPVNNNIDIIDWAKNNREFLEKKLIESGGILFRDFSISSPTDFEKLAQAICPKLFENYGDLPRTGVSGKVYGSTPYPSEQAILFHNESSHMHCYPQKIWFSCMQPAQSRGETPIVDCRKLLQLLDPKLRDKFQQKQLMYVRNYTEGLDVSWQDFFGTADKKEVENYCHQAEINFEWKSNDGLKTSQVRPAIIKHPQTDESVFFNQLLLHHISCLQADVQEHMLSLFGEENLPRHVYYGDGSSIENSVVAEILAISREAQVSFPWQKGDVLMLDNILTAHGRNPYVGSRKIVVAMGDMISNQEVEK